jgi:hypothetical protein
MQGMAAAAARGQGFTASALSHIPWVGGPLGAAVGSAMEIGGGAIAQESAFAGSAGRIGTGTVPSGARSRAMRMGVNRQQLIQQASMLGPMSGMRGEPGMEMSARLIALERTTGISGAAGAGLIGAAGLGGKEASLPQATKMLHEAVAAGVGAGFRDQKWGEYLQTVAQETEQMRRQGIMMDPSAMHRVVMGMSGITGFKGETGAAAAKNMLDVVRQGAEGNTFFDMMGFNAAMSNPEQMRQAVQKVLDREGSNLDISDMAPGALAQLAMEQAPEEVLPLILREMGAQEGSREGVAMMLKHGMKGKMSFLQALAAVDKEQQDRFASGKFEGPDIEDSKSLIAREFERTKGPRGTAAARAALDNKKFDIGKRISGKVLDIEKAEMDFAEIGAKIGVAAAHEFHKQINRYGAAATGKDPGKALFELIMSDMVSLAGKLFKNLFPDVPIPTEPWEDFKKNLNDKEERERSAHELEKIPGVKKLSEALLDLTAWVNGIIKWLRSFVPMSLQPSYENAPNLKKDP